MTAQPTSVADDIDALTYIYLAALKSNSDEIARLAEALRKAEDSLAELIEHHQQHHQGNESIRADAAEQERDALFGLTEDVSRLLSERNAARADAERLASSIAAFIHSRRSDTGLSEYDRIIRELETALAAHRAASGKAVTG